MAEKDQEPARGGRRWLIRLIVGATALSLLGGVFLFNHWANAPGLPGNGAGALFNKKISVPADIPSKSRITSARSAGPSVISFTTTGAGSSPPSEPI